MNSSGNQETRANRRDGIVGQDRAGCKRWSEETNLQDARNAQEDNEEKDPKDEKDQKDSERSRTAGSDS
jgi:hypothetical protein